MNLTLPLQQLIHILGCGIVVAVILVGLYIQHNSL
jgi:hypothetical protein